MKYILLLLSLFLFSCKEDKSFSSKKEESKEAVKEIQERAKQYKQR